jgi:hypothetical protein
MTDQPPADAEAIRRAVAMREGAMWQEMRDKIAEQERTIQRLILIIALILFAILVFYPAKPNDPELSGVSRRGAER